MARDPFGNFSNIPLPLLSGVFLVVIGVLFLSPGANLLAFQAAKKVLFDGKWDGRFEDNQKRTGKGEYEFHEDKNSRLTVTVTWDEGRKEMKLAGERLGPNAMRLTGKYKDTTYRYIGDMDGNDLVLHYRSLDASTGESGFGVSRLTRQKK